MRKMSCNLSNVKQEAPNQKQLFRHNMQSLYQFILEEKRKKKLEHILTVIFAFKVKNLGSVKQHFFFNKGISGVDFE